MDRRELLKRVALLTGAAMVGGDIFLTGCKSDIKSSAEVSKLDVNLLNEIGGIILPAPPNSIGAKDVNIGEFIKMMVNDCYNDNDKKIFLEGCKLINSKFFEKHKTEFIKGSEEQKLTFLKEIDDEARNYNKNKKKEEPVHFFTMLRQLTILGFAVSKEAVDNKVFSWIAIPGRYNGAIPYKKGDLTNL